MTQYPYFWVSGKQGAVQFSVPAKLGKTALRECDEFQQAPGFG
jgi:hypothetical protein